MIPPSYGSSLFQNSSLDRKPRENRYSLGYLCPNGIPEDVLEKARTILSVVRISDSEDEPVTCGMPYNFVILNSPVTGHLGKRIINPNGEPNSDETYGGGSGTCEVTSVQKFRHRGSEISEISQKQ